MMNDITYCKNCKWHPYYDPPDSTDSFDLVFPDYMSNPCPFYCEDGYYSKKPTDDFFCKYGEEENG